MSAEGNGMRPFWRRDPAFWGAALLCAIHFSSFDIAHTPIVWDTRFYLYYASRIAHGDVPYRDFFEFKAPLSIFVGALFHRIGLTLGIEPVVAIRCAFLAVAAAAGVAFFSLARRLDGGRATTGFVAVGLYLSFTFFGPLVGIGVTPKTLVSLFAPTAALAISSRRFSLAGALGTLAFFDWQVGALAAVGALAGALATPGRRLAQAGRTVGGGVAAAAPIVLYLVVTGALAPAFDQIIGTLLDRGEEVSDRPMPARIAAILRTLHTAAGDQVWVAALGVLGTIVFAVWLWRLRRDDRFPAALCLGIFAYGIVAFSLWDFQSYFDLYILLCSVIAFATPALRVLISWGSRFLPARHESRASLLVAAAVVLSARPAWLGSRPDLKPPTVDAGATLEDQKEVLRRVQAATAGRRVVYLGASELPYLAEQANLVPFVYWDTVAWRYFRQPDDSYLKTRNRLFRQYGADVMVGDRTLPPEDGDVTIASANGLYRVILRPLR